MLVQRNNSIYSKKIDNKWIILEKNKKYTQELNNTASFIWELCEKPIETGEIIQKICLEFDVDKNQAAKDVQNFIKEYLEKEFLIISCQP